MNSVKGIILQKNCNIMDIEVYKNIGDSARLVSVLFLVLSAISGSIMIVTGIMNDFKKYRHNNKVYETFSISSTITLVFFVVSFVFQIIMLTTYDKYEKWSVDPAIEVSE